MLSGDLAIGGERLVDIRAEPAVDHAGRRALAVEQDLQIGDPGIPGHPCVARQCAERSAGTIAGCGRGRDGLTTKFIERLPFDQFAHPVAPAGSRPNTLVVKGSTATCRPFSST